MQNCQGLSVRGAASPRCLAPHARSHHPCCSLGTVRARNHCDAASRPLAASDSTVPGRGKTIARERLVVAASSNAAAGAAAGVQGERLGVVITGGSRGLGYALAAEFLARGAAVLICGRSEERLAAAAAALQQRFPGGEVHWQACDVSVPADVERLGAAARAALGTVHHWVNNAGQVTGKSMLADVDDQEIVAAVGSNVAGSLLGCRQAIRLMREQPAGSGGQALYHVWSCGFSPWGAQLSRSAVTHKATKTALTQLTASLGEELREAGLSHIAVHNLSPGMVLTDLLLRDSTPVARRIFNALAEEPETVAAALAPAMLAGPPSGAGVDYLTPWGAAGRMLGGLGQILGGGRFFDKDGRRVQAPGEAYAPNGVRLQYSAADLGSDARAAGRPQEEQQLAQ